MLPTPTLPGVNRPPVVTVESAEVVAGAVLPGATLVTAADPEGGVVSSYALWDGDAAAGSGFWSLDGVALAAQTRLVLTAEEFSRVEFHAGSSAGVEDFGATAADARSWSGFERFSVTTTTPNQPPVLSLDSFTLARGTGVDAPFFVHASDPDGVADVVGYVLRDGNEASGSGHWMVKGEAQAALTDIFVEAADLADVRWQAGDSLTGAMDAITVTAFDADGVSASATATIRTAANALPDLQVANAEIAAGTAVSVLSLTTVTDLNGDAITRWAIYDNTPGGGYFVYGDTEVAPGTYTELTAQQFAVLQFIAGAPGEVDHLEVRAYDGLEWSAPWDAFTVTAQAPLFEPQVF